ncbi:MAG: hypothetical protein LC659_04635, partial [Myxococcales bacterium]|nr:hypothetical protein [Myxococcales bacterium]
PSSRRCSLTALSADSSRTGIFAKPESRRESSRCGCRKVVLRKDALQDDNRLEDLERERARQTNLAHAADRYAAHDLVFSEALALRALRSRDAARDTPRHLALD